MSKIIASAGIRGAHKIVDRAEKKFREALDKFGGNHEVAFPPSNNLWNSWLPRKKT